MRPALVVNALVPIRICDNGGWTDTWFARHGSVFNIAVSPCVEVQVAAFDEPGPIVVHAENYGERYPVAAPPAPWGPHPLIEAAIAYMKPPRDRRLEIGIHSDAPTGAGTGTSAAVAVALVGALDRLAGGSMAPLEAARAAQRVEAEVLHRQCGVQDQLGCAQGGINYIEMTDYPRASVSPVVVSDAVWWELEQRLLLVYLGKSHDSSALHEQVIRGLEDAGPDHPVLNELRRTAPRSRDAVLAGDFAALGAAMVTNTDAQARLHPDLVGREATDVIAIARQHRALGWKVNGAGGEGGSLTLLCEGSSAERRALVRAVEAANPAFRHVPTRLSREGLRVWTAP